MSHAVQYKIVANVAGNYAWIPPHGRTMSDTESYYWPADVFAFHSRFTPNMRALAAIQNDVYYRRVTITSVLLPLSS